MIIRVLKHLFILTKKRDIRRFLLFLLLAIVMWFAEKLRQSYTMSTQFEIVCTDVPAGYITPRELPVKMRATVEGNGFSLVRMLITNSLHTTVKVAPLRRLSSQGRMWAIYVPQTRKTTTDLPEHVKLVDVVNDTIMIPLLTVRTVKMPVRVRQNYTVESQHVMSQPMRVVPDSVYVTATNDIIDTLRAVYTVEQPEVTLSDSVTYTMPLDIPNLAVVSSKSVSVSYFVEAFTEKRLTIPIQPINVPAGYGCKIFPSNAKVSFTVGMSDYERADTKSFSIVADLSSINPGDKEQRVKLRMREAPAYIRNVTMSPAYATFLLQK